MKILYGRARLAGAVSEQMLAEARSRARYQFEREGRIVSLTETRDETAPYLAHAAYDAEMDLVCYLGHWCEDDAHWFWDEGGPVINWVAEVDETEPR